MPSIIGRLLLLLATPIAALIMPPSNLGGLASASARHVIKMQFDLFGAIAKMTGSEFKPCRTMFIAALGDPTASAGSGAKDWGLWRIDPGPPGVYLKDFDRDLAPTGSAPAGWTWDENDWWVEEYGRIMEKPDFPMPAGKYIVTGDREVTTVLTVEEDGAWSLEKGTLYDVTHLPCRAARYKGGSPANADLGDFPVTPGAQMPPIPGTSSKQDYAVIFVQGVPLDWK